MTLPAASGGPRQGAPGPAPVPRAALRAPVLTSWRSLVVLCLLLAQLAFICATHLSGSSNRYFVWAPNDYSVRFTLAAQVNGRTLSSEDLEERYRLRKPSLRYGNSQGHYTCPPQRLTDYLRLREEAYGGSDQVRLTLRYRLNGHAPRVWRWSSP